MTNLLASPQNLPKLIILHGLNNNDSCFREWEEEFLERGFVCERLVLPGHGLDRSQVKNLDTALETFDEAMKMAIGSEPYFVIAYSYGALFLELWLELKGGQRPQAKVLMAPAFYLRKMAFIERALNILPLKFPIPSITPRKWRKNFFLQVWEYKTLLEGFRKYQTLPGIFHEKTMLLIDPKDEVVHAEDIKKETEARNPGFKVTELKRPFLKSFGSHHILFAKSHYRGPLWTSTLNRIERFLKA